jgi:hypothetical protein
MLQVFQLNQRMTKLKIENTIVSFLVSKKTIKCNKQLKKHIELITLTNC